MRARLRVPQRWHAQQGQPRRVADLGGLAKLKRVAFARILEHAGVDAAWLGTWEDLLDITFEPPTEFVAEGKENVCSSKRKRGGRGTASGSLRRRPRRAAA